LPAAAFILPLSLPGWGPRRPEGGRAFCRPAKNPAGGACFFIKNSYCAGKRAVSAGKTAERLSGAAALSGGAALGGGEVKR